MIGQFTPALRAIEDILPFRAIRIADRGEGDYADTTATHRVVGFSDGSNRRFDDTNHALTGEPIRLQPGNIVLAEAGEAITVPVALRVGSAGLVFEVDDVNDVMLGEALEDATAANQVIRIRLNPDNAAPL